MKTNIATTSEQSDRLLRCGVSADTADMMFTPHNTLSVEPYKEALKDRGYIPAWSLSALMTKVLPRNIRYKGHTSLLEITSSNWQSDEQIWEVAYDIDLGVEASDPIEACVLMVEKLVAKGYKLNDCPCREKGEVNE
jgi:hypothetical protein